MNRPNIAVSCARNNIISIRFPTVQFLIIFEVGPILHFSHFFERGCEKRNKNHHILDKCMQREIETICEWAKSEEEKTNFADGCE